jgi:hypothetical protein
MIRNLSLTTILVAFAAAAASPAFAQKQRSAISDAPVCSMPTPI